MGKVMKLSEVIETLSDFDIEKTIYAEEPWSESSNAIVERELESGGLPLHALSAGMAYFIEVAIATEFLEDYALSLNNETSTSEKCQRLINYAINDA